ncbi:hypothetical protein Naga_100003g91 [Nannochloropsis gaditana]|uniref:Phosphatidate phosphatase APP1 catalytic domain-containing protein n=1 Tax=Nannochloropsis gaditana TaxID=72520 RepID=W7UBU9_9STRA|nr:hypothetical protein Naga_100003g91 [Nannochloropsis gaditana]
MLKQQKRGHMSCCLPGCVSRRLICLLVSSTVLGAAGYFGTSASLRQRHAPDFAGFQGTKRLLSSPNHKIVTSIGAAITSIEKMAGNGEDGKKTGRASGDVRSGRILQVITDIDDTVKSSGGLRLMGMALGGIDTQYKRGQYYPGAFQFALELSRFGVPEGREPARVAVLTARAREFKFALELKPSHKVCRTYAAAGANNGVEGWGVGTVLYGSVKEWVCQSRKGLRKFRNFEALRAQDRLDRTDYVFVGDTGELDLQAGESMIRKYPSRIKALFMHYVSESRPSPPPPRDRTLLDVPVIYFRTYVGAAVKAAELGLLGPSGVEAVVARTLEEIEGGGSATGEGKGRRKRKATAEQVAEVMADIALAEAFMGRSKAGKEGRKQRRGEEALELVRELFRPPDTRLPARVSVRR